MPKYSSSAKVVDGSLVLSLPDAETPVVMNISLKEVKSAAFSVTKKKDLHILTMQLSETETRDIAPFKEKDAAVAALMAAANALESGSGQNSSNGASNSGIKFNGKGVLKWLAAIAVLFVLYWMISSISNGVPRAPLPSSLQQGAGAVNNAASAPAAGRPVTGQPMSADDFLSRGN